MLEDVIERGVHVLFVGINPDPHSFLVGKFYAGRSNHFWFCLNSTDLVWTHVGPSDSARMAKDFGVGFTNLCSRPTHTAAELTAEEKETGARLLKRKIRYYRPSVVCFLSIDAYKVFSGAKDFSLGLQPDPIYKWSDRQFDFTVAFVTPNSSAKVVAYQ
ncbi:uracil-DNA glycosylase-like protein [Zychaea mexicana]|uniref:uracil-DNA glycosylase-like protein n=1 Tax=Zychaea mexicana TaxID=64656 RepID=UPI0022FE5C5C|nr:uracil-DNA glycosylase-like protein [Zychaea mexicana]KAI9473377.1 uracil-DNA glycosylase-like protein [Zychaea mexicana]